MMVRSLLGVLLATATCWSDVEVRGFEAGTDSLRDMASWACDSSQATMTLDSLSPLAGKSSARLDYVLTPKTTAWPWVGAYSGLRELRDLQGATGIHIRLESSTGGRKIAIHLASDWYSTGHAIANVRWQWVFPLRAGVIDTVLKLSDLSVPSYMETSEPALYPTIPPKEEVLQGVHGVGFDINLPDEMLSGTASGWIRWDDLSIVGQTSLVPGIQPKYLTLRQEPEDSVIGHPDSVPSQWHWANGASTVSVKRNSYRTCWGNRDVRFDFAFANDPGKTYSAYSGLGLGLRGDSAWDLRPITRWEFAYNTPEATRPVWVHPSSNRYPQELVDSGVTYGWEHSFYSSARGAEAAVLYTSALKPPSWAKNRTRLLAMLPPVDSILQGVTGIEISPTAAFNTSGEVVASSASSYFQVNHFVGLGTDAWKPAGAMGDPGVKPTDPVSYRLRGFERGADSLLGDDPYSSDSSKAVLSLDSLNPISGKSSGRLDYVLDPRGTNYPYAGYFAWFGQPEVDFRKPTGLRIKVHSSAYGKQMEIALASSWLPLPHTNLAVDYRWVFPLRQGLTDTTLLIADAKTKEWERTQYPYLVRTLPSKESIFQGVYGMSFHINTATPVATAQSGYILVDDVALVGVDTLPKGEKAKILVVRDADYNQVSHPDSAYQTWSYGNAATRVKVRRNLDNVTWGSADFLMGFRFQNQTSAAYSAYAGLGLGFRGDSAWDLRAAQRWEFAENTPDAAREVWVHPISDRYPKELVDSGVVYGWNETFHSSFRQWEGHVMYKDSLRPPEWAKNRTRLLAMLPPLDTILQAVKGIEFNPRPLWDADGLLPAGGDTSSIQVNHVLVVGLDTWKPAPGKIVSGLDRSGSRIVRWRMAGRTLVNGGSMVLEVFGPDGRLQGRIPPGTSRALAPGLALIRSVGKTTTLVVP